MTLTLTYYLDMRTRPIFSDLRNDQAESRYQQFSSHHADTHIRTSLPNALYACFHDKCMTIYSNLKKNETGFRQTHSAENTTVSLLRRVQ